MQLMRPNMLGRNKDYLNLAVKFTIDVMKDKAILNMFPANIKGYSYS